jgi:hypothetical protein
LSIAKENFKRMKMKYTLPLLCILFSLQSYAQGYDDWPAYYVQMNGSFQMGIPLDAMSRQLTDDIAFGGGGSLLFQLKRGRPLFIGAETGWMRYDQENLEYTTLEEGIEEDYRLTTNARVILWHSMVRFKPFTGSIWQPYLDGIFGFKTLSTRTKLYYLFDDEEEFVEADTDLRDIAWSYGAGVGVQILLISNPDITLDIRCAYLAGTNATYNVRNEDAEGPFNDPLDAFEERSSPTNMLIPQIGITFQFSDYDL